MDDAAEIIKRKRMSYVISKSYIFMSIEIGVKSSNATNEHKNMQNARVSKAIR
jgi:hypothetical protein